MAVTATGRRIRKRKLKAEINVVPYIDVMLVLLIIFMVTAPLLNLGVDIDLPKSNAKAVHAEQKPVILNVYPDGTYGLKLPDQDKVAVSPQRLVEMAGAIHRQDPAILVLVAGDGSANYQNIMDAIDLLREAGIEKVSLVTDQKQGPE
ncbi:MAG: protein TolR [Luteimonas sp.]